MNKEGALDNKYWVEKSIPLVWAKFIEFNQKEIKILETYLSRIDARDDGNTEVIFTKREYEQLVDVSEIKPAAMDKYITSFLRKQISLNYIKNGKEAWHKFTLFSDSRFEWDDELGQYIITIDCNPKLKSLFFNLAEQGYVRYRLRNILNLSSKHAIKLYPVLKDVIYKHGGVWKIDLSELKEVLEVSEDSSYNSFKEFNRAVLKKVQKEINSNTDIHFEYDKIMYGKKVKGIKLDVKQIRNENEISGQLNIIDWEEEKEKIESEKDEIMKIQEIFSCKEEEAIDVIECAKIHNMKFEDIIKNANYVIEKNPKHKINYLIKAIENDYASDNKKTDDKKTIYNFYEQRNYNYDELEKKLLKNKNDI